MRLILNPNRARADLYPKYNPNLLPNQILGLVVMLGPTAHTTQQKVLIGQSQTKNKSHQSRCIL